MNPEEVFEEQGDVPSPFPQRRNLQGHMGQSEIEILTESPITHRSFEVGMCSRDDPHVHGALPCVSQAADFAVLEYTQEATLKRQFHVTDLIEAERPTGSHLEKPRRVAPRVREGPSKMAKELVLDEMRGQLGAVHLDEGPLSSRATVVEGVGDELLAGPTLAANQNPGVGERHSINLLSKTANRLVVSENLPVDAELGLEGRITLAQAVVLEGVGD